MRVNDDDIKFESLNDEELDKYMSLIDSRTPDLWDRISEGFDKEYAENTKEEVNEEVNENNIENEAEYTNESKIINFNRNNKKKRNNSFFGLLAAGVIITIIAVPLAMNGFFHTGRKSDGAVSYSNDILIENSQNKYADSKETFEEVSGATAETAESCESASDEMYLENEDISFESEESCEAASDEMYSEGENISFDSEDICDDSEKLLCSYQDIIKEVNDAIEKDNTITINGINDTNNIASSELLKTSNWSFMFSYDIKTDNLASVSEEYLSRCEIFTEEYRIEKITCEIIEGEVTMINESDGNIYNEEFLMANMLRFFDIQGNMWMSFESDGLRYMFLMTLEQ